MTTLTGKDIQRFQIRAQMGAVKLEAMGMKHSGGNITPKLKKHYNLPRNTSHQHVIERLAEELEELA